MNTKYLLRVLIILGLVVIVALTAACASTPPAPTAAPQPTAAAQATSAPQATAAPKAASFDWKKYAGTSIKVYTSDSGQIKFIKPKLSEFETLTGMKVELESADATSYRTNLPVQLTAKSSDFDVMATFPETDGMQFSANGWYEPLDKYISDTTLTSPEFDFQDFPAGVRNAMKVKGNTVGILWETQTDIIYYRKDLLKSAGLAVPNTYDEWTKAIEAINNPSKEIYGVALRGSGYQMTTPFSAFLIAYCGSWVDSNGKAAINSKQALQAFEMYGRWGSKSGPPGIVTFDWQVPSQQFQQGKVFAFLDINTFVPTLEDKDKSRVAGNIGYAMVPEGPCGRAPFIGGWGWGVNTFSKKKEAAWYFIQWAANKKNNLDMILAGWPSPRSSAWNDAQFKSKDPYPEFTKVVLQSFDAAKAQMNPPVAPGVQAREVVGVVGNAVLGGTTGDALTQVANQQNGKLQALIDAMKK